ncbi:MAG: hypothetical protein V3W19_10000 [Desulfatiglandales bacterium]
MNPDVWFDLPVKTVTGGTVGCATIVGYLLGFGIIFAGMFGCCRIMLFLVGV